MAHSDDLISPPPRTITPAMPGRRQWPQGASHPWSTTQLTTDNVRTSIISSCFGSGIGCWQGCGPCPVKILSLHEPPGRTKVRGNGQLCVMLTMFVSSYCFVVSRLGCRHGFPNSSPPRLLVSVVLLISRSSNKPQHNSHLAAHSLSQDYLLLGTHGQVGPCRCWCQGPQPPS